MSEDIPPLKFALVSVKVFNLLEAEAIVGRFGEACSDMYSPGILAQKGVERVGSRYPQDSNVVSEVIDHGAEGIISMFINPGLADSPIPSSRLGFTVKELSEEIINPLLVIDLTSSNRVRTGCNGNQG